MDEKTRKMLEAHLAKKGFTQQATEQGVALAAAAIRNKFPKGGN